ncbi:MAG: hypothetical protein HDR72_00935 [Ruminococcaceae bacterium]|nr:hypothetical protein [Oscillospiraceae bacterium]
MNKTTAMVLLVALNIVATLLIGMVIMLLIYSFGLFAALVGIGFLIEQIKLSVHVYKRFNRRYDIPAKRYVLYAALPPAVLSFLGIIVMINIERGYMEIPGTICALGLTIYSAAYLLELQWRLAELPRDNARNGEPDE